MYLTEDQSPSTKGHLSMVRQTITIGKFLRWIFLDFVLLEFLIVLHFWPFEKSDLLRFGDRSFCRGYRSFCNLVCLYYFQLFISWLRLLIFTTITVRSSILICSMNILFVLLNCIFYPIRRPYVSLILVKSCNPPVDTPNGTVVTTGLNYLSHAVVVCDQNFYVYSGQASRVCNADGQWEGHQPVCKGMFRF